MSLNQKRSYKVQLYELLALYFTYISRAIYMLHIYTESSLVYSALKQLTKFLGFFCENLVALLAFLTYFRFILEVVQELSSHLKFHIRGNKVNYLKKDSFSPQKT